MINPAADPTGGGTRRLAIPGAATLLLPAALGISVARAATKRLFGSTIPVQLRMSALRVVGGTALAAAALASIPVSAAATPGRAAPTQGGSLGATVDTPAVAYSADVTQICAGALLFDNAHQMGTRADALSIADDIRASTARRLDRVTAVSVPPELQNTNSRWIDSERRLAALYATTWVRIYDTIDATHTPAQRTTLPKRLEKLIHAPDTLKRAAGLLELDLHVPDCTGGGS